MKYYECGPGWYPLIEVALTAFGENFEPLQIKEKFGELRIYGGKNERQQAVYDLVTLISRHICEECGKAGVLSEKNGWYRTRCAEHDT